MAVTNELGQVSCAAARSSGSESVRQTAVQGVSRAKTRGGLASRQRGEAGLDRAGHSRTCHAVHAVHAVVRNYVHDPRGRSAALRCMPLRCRHAIGLGQFWVGEFWAALVHAAGAGAGAAVAGHRLAVGLFLHLRQGRAAQGSSGGGEVGLGGEQWQARAGRGGRRL